MAAFPLGGCHRGHSHSHQGYKIAIPSHMADMVATAQSHNNHIEASFGKIALSDAITESETINAFQTHYFETPTSSLKILVTNYC